MSDFLCIGDIISLYCEENEGYVFSWQSGSEHNGLHVYQWQDRDKPSNIPTPQVVQFQICIQNRYKLNKKYRKLVPASSAANGSGSIAASAANPSTSATGAPAAATTSASVDDLNQSSLEMRTIAAQAKLAADAENEDNVSEQRRQHGKRVRYGEVIQLKHVFSGKFIHVSTTQTSRRNKNNMLVYLQNYNAKHAQFKLLPRYKVKSEGEFVQLYDQVIFESTKSPGQFFHVSSAWKIDHFTIGSELNLGIQAAGFTVVKSCRPTEDLKKFITGGSVVRLFHKELEAYLVAEGLFEDEVTEDVHLRIREVDQLIPKSLYPSSSGNTYWQVEAESSLLHGDVIRWEQQIRFRHMTTRQYLCITSDRHVTLIADCKDPRTVFRLHPVIKETDEISFESYSRIEHVITGYWLHALRDEEYVRRQLRENTEDSGDSMKSLRWDGATLRKISASGEKMYHDAYTIQRVEPPNLTSFNYAAGMVPFLLNLIQDRQEGKILNAKKGHKITVALDELRSFMIVSGVASKEKQKLMRNLRIIDLLVRLLQCPLQGAPDQTHLTRVFRGAYDVLYTYMIGNSRKNSLYFAKYIDFFQTQITVKAGDIGLNVAQMIVELIRDNRKIVDRITQDQIEMFVGLLKLNKNYRYLDLLNVLCVCDGVAIPDNQVYITEHWLRRDRVGMRFLTERGQNVNGQPNIIYVSTDNGATWLPLHEFVDRTHNLAFSEEEAMFFEHQLDLFGKLAYGRNDFAIHVMTRELGILTWDEAFLSLRSTLLPDSLRAKYCELIIGLFIDVGTNYSVLDHTNLSFIYEDVLCPGPNADGEFIIKDLVTLFPVIRDWIVEFLDENKDMTASMVGRNMLIEQVLRLFHFLVKFGYYSSEDIRTLLKPLINLLNGKLDKPFPPDTDKGGFTKDSMKLVQAYRASERYEPNVSTAAIVNAKYQALDVLDLLLTFQFNTRLESFIAKFKTAEVSSTTRKTKLRSILSPLLYDTFDPFDTLKPSLQLQKKAMKELRAMFDTTAYFDSEQITAILMDLSNYKYNKMVNRSLALLNKFYSAKSRLFKMGVQAMVLITTDSCHVHREIARTMPILRRFSRAKLNNDQVKSIGAVLDRYTEFCHMAKEENERHPMNQNILINHEVLTLVFDMLSMEIDAKLTEQYRGLETILKKCLKLLKALARGNDMVQMRIFERLDSLLKIKVVEVDLAVALKETFIGNQVTCLKILPQQIQAIVELAAVHLEKVPDFLDLLVDIVKVEDMGLTLKRNQSYVMKYLMQTASKESKKVDDSFIQCQNSNVLNILLHSGPGRDFTRHLASFVEKDYSKLAYVFDQSREFREKILTMQLGKDHLKYLISFIDLLATCAEGENRFIESMCQTILSVDELLWIINHPDIDCNLKKPFLRYFLWVYMKTAGSAVESGAGDLPHDGNLWKFLQKVAKDACILTEYISRNQETTSQLLKKCPGKWEMAVAGDVESVVHCTLHYFFDAVMVVVQAFFTKFYVPEKDLYPQEVENTDKLARALVGFCEAVIPLVMLPNHFKAIISGITAVVPSSSLPNSPKPELEESINGHASHQTLYGSKKRSASKVVMESLIEQLRTANRLRESRFQQTKGHKEYYQAELDLNAKLRTFAVNCSLLYGGHNTVQAQLKYKSKRELGGDEELPLGEEFQEHLKRFLRPNEKKVQKRIELVKKLVDQLAISSEIYRKLTSEAMRLEQEDLDIRCLQLLRAVIHNEERKLPEDWEENITDNKKQIALISTIQIELNNMGAVIKALPHLARPTDRTAKEVLSFVCIMLFNANAEIQSSLLHYFLHTREESFFAAIRNRMHLSALAIKERRSLVAQQRARAKEVLAQNKSMQSTMAIGKKALQEIQAVDNAMKKNTLGHGRKVSLSTLQSKAAKRRTDKPPPGGKQPNYGPSSPLAPSAASGLSKSNGFTVVNENKIRCDRGNMIGEQMELEVIQVDVVKPRQKKSDKEQDRQNEKNREKESLMAQMKDDSELEEVDQKDDGYIELVLRVLARMCDGQHQGLQNYLREQPDNIKSFNIVAETAQFVNLVYSNINSQNVDLCIQLFETLNEFTVGNQSNRSVMLNSKVVDYVNFILRAAEFQNCSAEKVLRLKMTIGNLIMSMIEENNAESIVVAKEIKDTMDKEAVYRCMTDCYESFQSDRPKLEDFKGNLGIGMNLQSARNLAKMGTKMISSMPPEDAKNPEFKEALEECGFIYFLILARLHDIDPKLVNREDTVITPQQQEAFNYFRKNTMSIEILKDDNLQKVNFRVKNKNVLREEIKEKLTWNVDRSSPSNKIRDLMKWSKDILIDIYYQRKILSNPVATFFTKNWLFWSKMVTLLSVVINVLMLCTWNARASLDDTNLKNATKLPDELFDPNPVIELEQYDIIIYSLGGAHILFSFLVLVTYFLSNHPTMPSFSGMINRVKSICVKPETDEEKERKVHESKLEVRFLSFTTLYYVIFMATSVAGLVFQGYFFAFHLLNIVNTNQLLKGVIQAVAQNGRSLLWVAVLGFVVFYLYALISFALLRSSFNPENELYCATLWQCTVTVIRYGLIGDLFDNLTSHPLENTFVKFGFLVIFHLSFFIFITTIGLNIILGIIVDTFSELRNLKWTAERDMIDTCFICSRSSYDFEHHGQGFEHHINQEHHIWAYIFFFIHLNDTKQSDYTSLELYVHKFMLLEKNDFFPLNRALSLSAMDEDSTESKVDDLLRQVHQLVERQREEDLRKKRDEERQKQLRWREEHRIALLQTGGSRDGGAEIYSGIPRPPGGPPPPPPPAPPGAPGPEPYSSRSGSGTGHHDTGSVKSYGGEQAYRQKQWRRGERTKTAASPDDAGPDSLDTQDSNATPSSLKGRRSKAAAPEHTSPLTASPQSSATPAHKRESPRPGSTTPRPRPPAHLVDDSTLLIRGSVPDTSDDVSLPAPSRRRPRKPVATSPSKAHPAHASDSSPVTSRGSDSGGSVTGSGKPGHLIDFGDDRSFREPTQSASVAAADDPMELDQVKVQLSRSASSDAGSSTPRATSPPADRSGFKPLSAADVDSRASTLARDTESPPPIAPAAPKMKPTEDVLLELDDLTSPLPLPPTVRRRSPLPVTQWPVAPTPVRPAVRHPEHRPSPSDEPSAKVHHPSKKSPSSSSSLDRKTPTSVAVGVVPADDEREMLLGAAHSSADEEPGAYSVEPEPSGPDGSGSAERMAPGEYDDEEQDDDEDNNRDDDDDEDEIELDLRFMPGDFKSTNV